MNAENTSRLLKKYPKIFRQYKLSCKQTAMCWGFDCGNGWFWLIDVLCGAITEHIKCNKDVGQVEATQVKEKWGGLRFYIDGGDDYIDHIISFAEGLSFGVCELCGAMDGVTINKTGWLQAKCKKCREEKNEQEA